MRFEASSNQENTGEGLKKFIFISLILIFSCENGDELLAPINEVDVDWVIVRTQSMNVNDFVSSHHRNDPRPKSSSRDDGEGIDEEIFEIGYYFLYTNTSEVTNVINFEISADTTSNDSINIDFDGNLTFDYKNQSFSYDVSDSYFEEEDFYLIESYEGYNQRIIYNQELGYFTIFGSDGFLGVQLNSLSPNELIDYR